MTKSLARSKKAGYDGIALAALTRHKQLSREKIIVLANQARADGRERDIHMLHNL